jgi:DNA polymerase/3'-5' exonuclease PolX
MIKSKLDNKDVSAVLEEVGFLLELKGENPFKVKAYSIRPFWLIRRVGFF